MSVTVGFICVLFFFFFKQKTAYDMRISDWSSDVCSSDLLAFEMTPAAVVGARPCGPGVGFDRVRRRAQGEDVDQHRLVRSEESRVGKECVSTGRYRWSTNNEKKKNKNKT